MISKEAYEVIMMLSLSPPMLMLTLCCSRKKCLEKSDRVAAVEQMVWIGLGCEGEFLEAP